MTAASDVVPAALVAPPPFLRGDDEGDRGVQDRGLEAAPTADEVRVVGCAGARL